MKYLAVNLLEYESAFLTMSAPSLFSHVAIALASLVVMVGAPWMVTVAAVRISSFLFNGQLHIGSDHIHRFLVLCNRSLPASPPYDHRPILNELLPPVVSRRILHGVDSCLP